MADDVTNVTFVAPAAVLRIICSMAGDSYPDSETAPNCRMEPGPLIWRKYVGQSALCAIRKLHNQTPSLYSPPICKKRRFLRKNIHCVANIIIGRQ